MTAARNGAWPHRAFPSWLDAARWSGGTNLLWGGIAGTAGATTATQLVDVAREAAAIDAGRAVARLSAELGGGLAVIDHMTATRWRCGSSGPCADGGASSRPGRCGWRASRASTGWPSAAASAARRCAYRLIVAAVDPAGNRSSARPRGFRIVH